MIFTPSALFSLLDSYMVFTVTFDCYLQSSFCVEDQVAEEYILADIEIANTFYDFDEIIL